MLKTKIYKNVKLFFLGILNLKYFLKLNQGIPLVIGGCGRSGTTLLLTILSAHPKLHGIKKETGILRRNELGSSSRFWTLLKLSGETFHDKKIGATSWVEKTPRNVNNFATINSFFRGKVKFIHIVRDGRDVILSKHPTKSEDYWVSKERWINDVKNGLLSNNYENLLMIKYEDLILNFETTLKEILGFLDLEFCEEVFTYEKYTTISQHPAWDHDVKKVFNGSIGKWKQEGAKERICDFMNNPEAVDLMAKLDYDTRG